MPDRLNIDVTGAEDSGGLVDPTHVGLALSTRLKAANDTRARASQDKCEEYNVTGYRYGRGYSGRDGTVLEANAQQVYATVGR